MGESDAYQSELAEVGELVGDAIDKSVWISWVSRIVDDRSSGSVNNDFPRSVEGVPLVHNHQHRDTAK